MPSEAGFPKISAFAVRSWRRASSRGTEGRAPRERFREGPYFLTHLKSKKGSLAADFRREVLNQKLLESKAKRADFLKA